jgi:hypothetical protein
MAAPMECPSVGRVPADPRTCPKTKMLRRTPSPIVVLSLLPLWLAETVRADTFAVAQTVLRKYCQECHAGADAEGGINLDAYRPENAGTTDRSVWVRVARQLRSRAMPPDDAPQPTDAERAALETWLTEEALRVDCSGEERPGRVTIRRLNRQEYDNTVRDLFGVDLHLADDFPSDDVGYGFDNIGDVLSLSPVLLERYVEAAEEIVRAVIASTDIEAAPTREFPGKSLTSTDQFTRDFTITEPGDYVLRVRAWGDQAGPVPCQMLIGLDGRPKRKATVPNDRTAPMDYEVNLLLEPGEHQLGVAFLNDFFLPAGPNTKKQDRNLHVGAITLIGPIGKLPTEIPDFHRAFMPDDLGDIKVIDRQTDAIKGRLNLIASRGFRRRATKREIDELAQIFWKARRNGETVERAAQLSLGAILVSPSFLFRVEAEPPDGQVRRLDDFELATRLSYFLWSSLPDEELFRAANRGELRTQEQIIAQARRMLGDPKAVALAENFAGQWLNLRGLDEQSPNRQLFPTFDEPLREAMRQETEVFFQAVVAADRSILDFLDADYTFVNERLAGHYGIAGVQGPEFRRVAVDRQKRGGLLGQASILFVTSNPTRTNPVKRGKWILENLFASPPPDPPANVPPLTEETAEKLTGTLRERMEKHRADPACATCHKSLDPLGFGLENYDAIGGWRDSEGGDRIDASGVLPDGMTFSGPAEMRRALLARSDDFRRCFAEKLLTYALGRGLEYYDACAIERIVTRSRDRGDRFSAYIEEVVSSPAFQQRESGASRP